MTKRKARYIETKELWMDNATICYVLHVHRISLQLQQLVIEQTMFYLDLLKTRQNTFRAQPRLVKRRLGGITLGEYLDIKDDMK